MIPAATDTQFIPTITLNELRATTCQTVQLEGHIIVLWYVAGEVYAVDNRCPHMGFPLDKGTVKDGILTCHWHHARFDLESGGTFDQWADDVRSFPVEIRDGRIHVNVSRQQDPNQRQTERLAVGLERNLSLVIAKAALVLDDDPLKPFRAGLTFGTANRRAGWGQGLTILTCLMNLRPLLDAADRPRALYQGLAAVASDTAGSPPRFPIRPLPGNESHIPTLKRWFRRFIEVRDAEGAERCVVSAVRAGATPQQMADMLFTAVTDHRYIQNGHPADFTNKAFEALDTAGWEYAEPVLTSLVSGYAWADRMEESNAWRNPVDLIAILQEAFARLQALETVETAKVYDRDHLLPVLLGDDPQAIADVLLEALENGVTAVQLAETVSYAAALRIAHFHTSNEFGDWDTALHTFTFANAIEQGLRRAPSRELLRGVFDAAMSIYLDRFLNIPSARLPQVNGQVSASEEVLAGFPALLDKQQQVSQSAELVARYLGHDGDPQPLLAMLGRLLLREDRDFHTIQTVEAAFKQYERLRGTEAGSHVLIAAARYLAAHAPTVRAQGQTYQIAARLHRGEHLFVEEAA